MQLNRSKNPAEAMIGEAPCPSGQWFQQESYFAVQEGGILTGNNVKNNISVQTGEEFSIEFLQDRAVQRQVPSASDKAQNHEKKNGRNSNLNHQMGYEELNRILGLQRMDSECGSDITEFASARGSTSGPPSAPLVNESQPSLSYQNSGLGVSDESQSGKIKFLCSSGGKILPRPGDGKLRYVGGETRIISMRKNLSWVELLKKTCELCNQPYTIKYQLPGEDLDALISVSSDEDIQNMIEEYHGLEETAASQRLRIFLIPLSELENTGTLDANTNQISNPDYHYVVAVNGILDHYPMKDDNGQSLESEVNQSKTHSNRNPSFHENSHTSLRALETNESHGVSHVTPLMNESPNLIGSLHQSPAISPMTVQLDLTKGHKQAHKDNPVFGSTESPSMFNAAQLHPENSCNGNIAYCRPPQVDINLDTYGIERPVLKGRTFHSENPISYPVDTTDLLLGSNDSIGFRPGMPHAYSDPQLQERGGNSAYCSQEGMAALNFATPPLSSQAVQENVVVPNHTEENRSNCDIMLGIDVKDPPSLHCEKLRVNRSPATAMGYMTESSNISSNPISNLGIGAPPIQEFHISDHRVPASLATNLNPFADATTEQPLRNYLKISPAELAVKNQRTAKNEHHVLTGRLSELPNSLASPESAVPLPSPPPMYIAGHEPILVSSKEPQTLAVCDDPGPKANLNGSTWLQNPTESAGSKRGLSLLEEDFFSYTYPKVENSGPGDFRNEKQEDTSVSKNKEQNQVDLVLDSTNSEVLSPSAAEAESIIPESESEDVNANNGGKDEPFSDALIAEMEADIYGLQIIKNADLEELRELGSGTYGTVYHGRWRGSDVAIKRIKKSCFAGRSSEQERLTQDFWREARILSNLHHPNVVAFYGVVPDGAGGTLATVTEFMANGSLRSVLLRKDRSLDRRRRLMIAMDAAFGMEYLHLKNIVHFDLKCDNLLVNMRDPQRPICKVGDFGLSRIKRNTLVSGGVRGTLPWMAPELLNGSSSRVSEKVDVFSFGIVMWEILTGDEPYASMHCGAIIGGIVKNTLRPPIPDGCDSEWRKLMEQCWSADPEVRPSFTEVTNRLRLMSMALQAKGHHNPARDPKPNITA